MSNSLFLAAIGISSLEIGAISRCTLSAATDTVQRAILHRWTDAGSTAYSRSLAAPARSLPFAAEIPMWLLMLPLLMQTPTARQVLEAEHARGADVSVLMAATRTTDVRVQRLAVRALGRFERASLRDSIVPLLKSPNVDVRRETVNALGKLNAVFDFAALLPREKSGRVRAVIYETLGRVTPAASGAESREAAERAVSGHWRQAAAYHGRRVRRGDYPHHIAR